MALHVTKNKIEIGVIAFYFIFPFIYLSYIQGQYFSWFKSKYLDQKKKFKYDFGYQKKIQIWFIARVAIQTKKKSKYDSNTFWIFIFIFI